ncbi:MAG: ABC transporter permease, partial [Candidatus Bipolaricaulia bacterium]
ELGPISLFGHKLFAIGIAALLGLALWRGLRATRWGKAIRAMAQNREAAALSGVNVGAVSMLAFAVAGGLSGLAGAVTAPVAPFTPFAGRLAIIKAFAISRIGRGSVRAVIGLALLVGVAESLTVAYLSAEFSDLLPLGVLILVMLLRIETLGPEEHLTAGTSTLATPTASAWSAPRWAWIVGGGIVLALPLLLAVPPFVLHLLIISGILAICVTSADLLYGVTGLPSLAQGAFWGLGAYTSALMMMHWGTPPLVSLLGTLALALAVGAGVGSLGVRAGRHWALFTFITTVLFTLVALSLDVTGGPNGLTGIPLLNLSVPGIGEVSLNPFLHKASFYGLVALGLIGVLALRSAVVRSWFGRALASIREDEGLARSIGVPTRSYKVMIFALSAAIAGFGGFLYAHYLTYLHPDLFNFITSFNILMMNKIGGLATILGPVLGPLAVTTVDELTRPINAYISEVIFGVLLILTILYLPSGLIGGLRRLVGPLWARARAINLGRISP